jgi:hypothetical protein
VQHIPIKSAIIIPLSKRERNSAESGAKVGNEFVERTTDSSDTANKLGQSNVGLVNPNHFGLLTFVHHSLVHPSTPFSYKLSL